MTGQPQSSRTTLPHAARWRRRWTLGGVALALVVLLVGGRGVAAWQARQAAARRLDAGALGAAQRWLEWAARLTPNDGRVDLLQAACWRHLGQQDPWRTALEAAERKGARLKDARRERTLGQVRWGAAERISPGDFDSLVNAGSPPREALAAVVHGLLAKGELAKAKQLLDARAPDADDEAQAAYLRGMYYWSAEQRQAAQAEFESALATRPDHEMARASLGRLLEQQDLLTQALAHYRRLATAAPQRESVQVDLARVLRKLGRMEEARRVLPPPASPESASPSVAIELAERAYESGDYAEARRWFERADVEGPHVADTLRAAASTFALNGDVADAQRLFARIDEAQSLSRHVGELQRRIAIDPGDHAAAGELQHLMASEAGRPQAGTAGAAGEVSSLYGEHCAACHGANGDGKGRAARHLYPRPRDFQGGQLRLVSALNGVATQEDIERVIRRGIPGTAMPAFGNLSDEQRIQLAQRVQQFQRDGVRARVSAAWERDGERVDDAALQRTVTALTTPAEILHVPALGPATTQAIARGRDVYLRAGCHHCHATDGSGAADVLLFDDAGQPAAPRDLTRDPLKGGPEAESLSRRIRLGMPGSPHPAATSLDDKELIDLVHFCQSLSKGSPQFLTNHERARRAAAFPHSAEGEASEFSARRDP